MSCRGEALKTKRNISSDAEYVKALLLVVNDDITVIEEEIGATLLEVATEGCRALM